jgi:hypothetical protein
MRLLQHTSISDQAEESLISKLKVELGAQHVAKYIQMNVDMKNSREGIENFKKKDHGGVIQGVELLVKVLTSGLWGNMQNVVCKLPDDMNLCTKKFEDFYKLEHVGRHLVWNAGVGECEVKSLFCAKPYTFILTVYQSSVLLLYNNADCYTFQQLIDQTKLPTEILKKQLLNLTNPKMGKLLIKANLKTPNFTPDETVQINKAFASTSLRVNMVPIVSKKVKKLIYL